MEYLGHIVSPEGIKDIAYKKGSDLGDTTPKYHTGVKSFLGLVGYFHDFIPKYAELSKTLTGLTSVKVKHKKLEWTYTHHRAFEALKRAAANCATLVFPSKDHMLVPRTDAFIVGIGAHLVQVIDRPTRINRRLLQPDVLRNADPKVYDRTGGIRHIYFHKTLDRFLVWLTICSRNRPQKSGVHA